MFSKEYIQIYLYSFLNGVADSMIAPFLVVYALQLGANNWEIALMSSLITFFNMLTQVYLGFFQRIKKKLKLYAISRILWSLSWFLLIFSFNVYCLILILCFQTIFGVVSGFIWTNSFVANLSKYERLRVVTRVEKYWYIGSLISNLIFGYLIANFGFQPLFFLLAFLLSLSSFLIFFFRLPVCFDKRSVTSTFNLDELTKDKKFLKFVSTRSFLTFATSLISPFITVYLVKYLHVSTFELGIINSIGTIVRILVVNEWSLLVTFDENIKIIFATLIPISLYPLVYILSPHWLVVAIYAILGSAAWSGFAVFVNSHFTSLINKRNSFTYSAFFNITNQLASIFGNFLGGVLSTFSSLPLIFILSSFLRFSSIPAFLKLESIKLSSILSRRFVSTLKESFLSYREIFDNVKESFLFYKFRIKNQLF